MSDRCNDGTLCTKTTLFFLWFSLLDGSMELFKSLTEENVLLQHPLKILYDNIDFLFSMTLT